MSTALRIMSGCAALVLGLVGAMVPGSASAVDRGHITGTVTDAGGAPLAGVTVTAYAWNDWGPQILGPFAVTSVQTDASGAYDISELLTDSYVGPDHRDYYLLFSDESGDHAFEWYDNATSVSFAGDGPTDAVAIHVPYGTTVSGKDAQLGPASHITGTVTGPGGVALAGAEVTAYVWMTEGLTERGVEGFRWKAVPGPKGRDASVATDASGAYDLGGLAAGTYRIGLSDPSGALADEYFDGAPSVDLADSVTVAAGETATGKDVQLGLPSRITGTVTGPGGAALAGVEVTPYWWATEAGVEQGSWQAVTWPSRIPAPLATDASGTYSLDGLVAGSYRIGFRDPSGALVEEYLDVTVAAGETVTGRDVQLEEPPAPQTTTPKRLSVHVGAVRHRGRLLVNVNPNRAAGSWRFRVQRRAKSGAWHTRAGVVRTQGRSESRTLDLPRGTYRVVLAKQGGRLGVVSAPVRLRR